MINCNIRESVPVAKGFVSAGISGDDVPADRTYSWNTSSTSTVSSNSLFNKSEPVFRLNNDLSQPLFDSKQPLFDSKSKNSLQLSWRNPRDEMSEDLTSPVEYRSSSDTMSNDSWEQDEETGRRMLPMRHGVIESHDPCCSSSDEISESVFDNQEGSGTNKVGFTDSETTWLDDKLARDLSSIMPTFEFASTSFNIKRLSDRPMFSSTSSSECSSEESQRISYCSSPEFHPRQPRHSWAGSNLDIIDSDSGTLESIKAKRPRRERVGISRRNSFDRSFRYRKPSASHGTLKQNQNDTLDNTHTYLRFESQTKWNYNEGTGIPVLKHLVKSKSNSTELIIEGERLVIKFKRRKDYLCSTVKTKKRKVVLHLLDVINVLVLTGTNTLIIQFKESCKTKQIKEKSTLDKLSDTLRSSRSNSLSRSLFSDTDAELSELEVGRFHNCKDLATLILKQRQSLLPKGILKRGGSLRVRAVEPVIVNPAKLGISPTPEEELIEWVTYV